MVNFPTTLIIGLGGVGSEITAEIYRKFLSTNPSDHRKAQHRMPGFGYRCYGCG